MWNDLTGEAGNDYLGSSYVVIENAALGLALIPSETYEF